MIQHTLFKHFYTDIFLSLSVGIILVCYTLISLAHSYTRSYTAINPFPDHLIFLESPWILIIFVAFWIGCSWMLAYLKPYYYYILLCFNYGIDAAALGLIMMYGHAHEITTSYLLFYSLLLICGMTLIRQALAKKYGKEIKIRFMRS